tara:strand:+ start:408 stop:740 length:333 start_codon:yes stop_codon:yes gene_type:complete
MYVRELKEGMILMPIKRKKSGFVRATTTPKDIIGDEGIDRNSLFYSHWINTPYNAERHLKGPFIYLGCKRIKLTNQYLGRTTTRLERTVLTSKGVYIVWGHDFKHLESMQ